MAKLEAGSSPEGSSCSFMNTSDVMKESELCQFSGITSDRGTDL